MKKIKCRMCGGDIVIKSMIKEEEVCDYCGAKNSLNNKYRMANGMDIVFFGEYPQNNQNQKKDIEWIVLKRDENRLFLLSKYALDCERYHYIESDSTDWRICSLRNWLNSVFINCAFNKYEKDMILETEHKTEISSDDRWKTYKTFDRVFLLSLREIQELKRFSLDIRRCFPTEYAAKKHDCQTSDKICSWWTRTGGRCDGTNICIEDNEWEWSPFNDSEQFVRPALWVKL